MMNTGEPGSWVPPLDWIQGYLSIQSSTLMMAEAAIFTVCLMISAIFSGSETALTSMSKIRVKRLLGEGEESYRKLEPWLHDPNRFLATILVGNNFVNILASVLAAHLWEQWMVSLNVGNAVAVSSALAVATTTFLLLVFGEILPKTFSKEHATRISLMVIGPLDVLYRLLRPIILMFLFITNTVIRVFGGHTIREVPLLTEEDVLTLIEVGEREGILKSDEREMIASIIDFGDRTVREIMTPRVDFQSLSVDTPMERVLEEAVKQGRSRIPVFENDLDHVVGILYVKDLLTIGRDGGTAGLRELIRPALFIPNTKRIKDLLTTFRKEKTHIAMVVDEYGTTDGLVTIEDVLEEIVGDIQDEFDSELPDYETREDGSVVACGKIGLDELGEALNVEFPEEDVQTLGGFIGKSLGGVPKAGEQLVHGGFVFTVLESDERKVAKVEIAPAPEPEAGENGEEESLPQTEKR